MRSLDRNLAELVAKGVIDEKVARIKAQDVKQYEQYLDLAKNIEETTYVYSKEIAKKYCL